VQVSKLQPCLSGLHYYQMVSTTGDARQKTNGRPPANLTHRVTKEEQKMFNVKNTWN